MKQEIIPYGSGVKLLVKITNLGEEVVLSECPFSILITAGHKSITIDVEDPEDPPQGVTFVDNDSFTLAFLSTPLDRGDMYMRISVSVPDNDFPEGVRPEIIDYDLNYTLQ